MNDDSRVLRGHGAGGSPQRWQARTLALLTALVVCVAGGVAAQSPMAGSSARVLASATDLGPVSADSPIELTVWLKLRDTDGLDHTLAAQRAGGAWLSEAQIEQLHAPKAADAAAVGAFLRSRGLHVTATDPQAFFVKATGTAAAVDAAFQVQLHRYTLRDRAFHASPVQPTLPAAIAPLVSSVGGLNDLPATPQIGFPHPGKDARPTFRHSGAFEGLPWKLVPLNAAVPAGVFFSTQCFFPPTTVSFSNGVATASYTGTVYGANINNTAPGTLSPCGYSPGDLRTAYNITPLYQEGLDGTGETIAIIDAYGSVTLQQDVASYSRVMGLPPANIQVIGTPTGSEFSSDPVQVGWAGETTGDVEVAHAIAPGAKIIVVVAPTQSLDDLMAANLLATQQPGVVTISNSWGYVESFTDPLFRASADGILKLAAAKGIAVDFASGDSGNFTIDLGYEDVSYPASSPHATAVGGVSVVLDQNRHILYQTAWGDNATVISTPGAAGGVPTDPPPPGVFVWGGGGGVSNVYPLPPFQSHLEAWGQRRLLPDISWLADPLTGVELVITVDAQGDQAVGTGGGTSAACPMFSALWAIAVQKAGRKLGQAAPLLYRLPPAAIMDVLPPPASFTNVTGTLTDASGARDFRSNELGSPLQGQSTFMSVLYNSLSGYWYVSTFGTDSTLRAAPGWDPATGLGTPNGWAFVHSLAP